MLAQEQPELVEGKVAWFRFSGIGHDLVGVEDDKRRFIARQGRPSNQRG